MSIKQHQPRAWRKERGSILVMVSIAMILLMAVAGLAIDLASLYVARGEAQRAADAAALAGASVFVSAGYTSGLIDSSSAQAQATQRAIDVAAANKVAGENASVLPADITFDFSNPMDPRISVVVQRTSTRGNAVPTFFAKIFGTETVNVAASATAEAYNPSGSGSVGTKCLKPWLLPNCDPDHLVLGSDSRANPNCPSGTVDASGNQLYGAYFIDPATGSIALPGAPPTGAIGELIVTKPGDPSQSAAPGKFYPVFLPPGSVAAECPACATGSGGGGTESGALYRYNISCCNSNTVACGDQTVQPINGNMVGPTSQGVDCLIHQSGATGQDTLNASNFNITAGGNNPLVTAGIISAGTAITTSDSIITVPVYDGTVLCPGSSCPSSTTVTIVGFLQIFIKDETNPQGTVEAYVMNIAGCAGGSGGSGGSGTVVSSGGSPVPIRLIHP